MKSLKEFIPLWKLIKEEKVKKEKYSKPKNISPLKIEKELLDKKFAEIAKDDFYVDLFKQNTYNQRFIYLMAKTNKPQKI